MFALVKEISASSSHRNVFVCMGNSASSSVCGCFIFKCSKSKSIASTSFVIIIFLEYATCLFQIHVNCTDFVISSAARHSHTHTNTVYDVQLLCWNHGLVSCWVLSAHIYTTLYYYYIHILNWESECNGNTFVIPDFVVFIYKTILNIEIGIEKHERLPCTRWNPK